MRLLFLKYWDRIRSGFWFLPAFMVLAAILFAYATITWDSMLARSGFEPSRWVYTGEAEGASAVLTAIAGSMITIAGLVFSMTLVAMTLAASNFGPRLLQNFTRDTANQIVLGAFVATFLYCLLVLRTIRRADEGGFVPHVSVTIGVALALASLGVLIYFIHHVSVSIQANEIVARVGADLNRRVDALFPEQIGRSGRAPTMEHHPGLPESFARDAKAVLAQGDGYLQMVDADTLLELASKARAIFSLERKAGDDVVADSVLIRVWPAARLNDSLTSSVNGAFALGTQRTAGQDVGYVVGQLVEMAVRALSPGVNDPFTAVACVDRLSSALSRLAGRKMPSPYRYDGQNVLRVVATGVTFGEVANAAFDPIRRYGSGSPEVSIRLLQAMAVVAERAVRSEDLAVLESQARLVMRGTRDSIPEPADRRRVRAEYHFLIRTLTKSGSPKSSAIDI